MGGRVTDGQDSEQTIARGRAAVCSRLTDRGGRLVLLTACLAWLPTLMGCSSSALFDHTAATPPPARAVAPPAVSYAPTATARPVVTGPPLMGMASAGTVLAGISPPDFIPPTSSPAPLPPTVVSAAPVAAAKSDDEFDVAASAYPSVALFDLIRNQGNIPQQAKPAPPAPPVLSDSVTPATRATATGQPAPAASSNSASAAAAPAASTSSDDYDAAASAYPSVPLFDIFRHASN